MIRSICLLLVTTCAFNLLPFDSFGQKKLITTTVSQEVFRQRTPGYERVFETIGKRSKPGTLKIYEFNAATLQDSVFTLDIFPGQPLTVIRDAIDLRSEDDFSLYAHIPGANSKEGSLVLTYYKGELSGNLNYKAKNYAISPLGNGTSALYEIDFKSFPREDAPSNRNNKDAGDSFSGSLSGSTATYDHLTCRVRILVAYTSSAETQIKNTLGYSSINQFINQAIAETNQAHINSGVNFRVELAAAIRVSYTESGSYDTDLTRFQGTSDGYMDNVHTYRNAYSADVNVLIINNTAYCGLASTIRATASSAFCVVHYNCTLGYYSFAHEIGHLFGCRHDPETDPTTTPFAYGHGYVKSSAGWRTIMAYNISGETRIQYFSNPNVTYGGSAMGTASVSHNARVLNEQAGTVGGFRATPSTLTLNANHIIVNDARGDAIATTAVVLQPGFRVTNNAVFHAYIKHCSDLADSQPYTVSNTQESVTPTITEEIKAPFALFPNPSTGIVRITSDPSNKGRADITVRDENGRMVYRTNKQAADNMVLNLSFLSSGIYYVEIRASEKVISRKLVILK